MEIEMAENREPLTDPLSIARAFLELTPDTMQVCLREIAMQFKARSDQIRNDTKYYIASGAFQVATDAVSRLHPAQKE